MATLPFQTKINRDSYTETPPDRVLRTEMESGIDKTRRRTTNAPRPVSFKIFPLTDTEVTTFDDFYLANDAIRIDFTNPRTDTAVKARFTSAPKYAYVETGWSITVELEIIP